MSDTHETTSSRSRGFTLVELMISIAIVLLLVAGINLIFSTTSKAVGSGQALSEGARNNQAAQAVMYHDFSSCATDDAPFIVIYNHAIPAFRTLADQQGDRDYNPAAPDPTKILTVDLDNDNQEGVSPGETISPATYNDRNHRTDIVEFFARDVFKRQTGNNGTYVANEASNEAMIWYGHLNLPNNSNVYSPSTVPGAGVFGGNNNPNNFFATQWTLGRQAILLTQGNNEVINADGAAQFHSRSELPWDGSTALNTLYPLEFDSTLYDGTSSAGTLTLQNSRYDLADTSISDFSKRLKNVLAQPRFASLAWWSFVSCSDVNRFYANPFVSKPITSVEFAQTSPIFLPACSQFIVEFAGDFIKQLPTGALDNTAGPGTGLQSDGVIDFIVAPGAAATNPRRQIRWYGMPRDTDATNDTVGGEVISNALNSMDVVPARDVRGDGTHFDFERLVTSDPAENILNTAYVAGNDYAAAGAVRPKSYYVCAWGPLDTNRPSLIRITYSLDDPSNRLGNPLTYEYVFKIK